MWSVRSGRKARLVAGLAFVVVAGCSTSSPAENEPPPPPGPVAPVMNGTVNMVQSGDGYGGLFGAFTPAGITIYQGGTVRWRNQSALTHNVTFSGSAPTVLDTGDEHERTFPSVGTFAYSCTLHDGMQGSVSVVAQQ